VKCIDCLLQETVPCHSSSGSKVSANSSELRPTRLLPHSAIWTRPAAASCLWTNSNVCSTAWIPTVQSQSIINTDYHFDVVCAGVIMLLNEWTNERTKRRKKRMNNDNNALCAYTALAIYRPGLSEFRDTTGKTTMAIGMATVVLELCKCGRSTFQTCRRPGWSKNFFMCDSCIWKWKQCRDMCADFVYILPFSGL